MEKEGLQMERKQWLVLCQGCSPWWESPSEVDVGQHPAHKPGALCAMCCCFCPPQAEDRAKKGDSIQPSLQWPAALGHEATPQPRVGSGSSSSPCTPAPQRALVVQVLLPPLERGTGVVLGRTAHQKQNSLLAQMTETCANWLRGFVVPPLLLSSMWNYT